MEQREGNWFGNFIPALISTLHVNEPLHKI